MVWQNENRKICAGGEGLHGIEKRKTVSGQVKVTGFEAAT
jgi:hypothetical protein